MSEILISSIDTVANNLNNLAKRPNFLPFFIDFNGKLLKVSSLESKYFNGKQLILINSHIKMMFSNTFEQENLYKNIHSIEELKSLLYNIVLLAISATKDSSLDVFQYDLGRLLSKSDKIARFFEIGNKNSLPDILYSSDSAIKLKIKDSIVSFESEHGKLQSVDSKFKKVIIKKELLNSLYLFQIPKNQGIDLKSILDIVNYFSESESKLIKVYEFFTKNSLYLALQLDPTISIDRLFNYPLNRLKTVRVTNTTKILEDIIK